MKKDMMPRKKRLVHTDAILVWHDDYEEGSRESKIIHALAREEDFNDIFATSFVSDDKDLLCYSIGGN